MAKKRKNKKLKKGALEQQNHKNKPFDSLAIFKTNLSKIEDKKPKLKKTEIKMLEKEDEDIKIGDESLFFQAMSDVRPLRKKAINTAQPLPSNAWEVPQFPNEDLEVLQTLSALVSGFGEFDVTYTDEYVEAKVKGLPLKVMEQLRLGHIPYQDYLDLHGHTLLQAEAAIGQFILKAVSLGRTCVLLIHGRGHRSPQGVSILKQNLDDLLLKGLSKKYILAFTSARSIDGGLGASYVLLRR